jgi:hypothetical protein
MKAIFDSVPKYCPNCRVELYPKPFSDHDRAQLDDFHKGAIVICVACGMTFQKANVDRLRAILPIKWPGEG